MTYQVYDQRNGKTRKTTALDEAPPFPSAPLEDVKTTKSRGITHPASARGMATADAAPTPPDPGP